MIKFKIESVNVETAEDVTTIIEAISEDAAMAIFTRSYNLFFIDLLYI
jgi:hypothetical protein